MTNKEYRKIVKVALEARHLEKLRCSVLYYMHGLKHDREVMALVRRAGGNPGAVGMYTDLYTLGKSMALAGPKGKLP